jgi:hypothetical protein
MQDGHHPLGVQSVSAPKPPSLNLTFWSSCGHFAVKSVFYIQSKSRPISVKSKTGRKEKMKHTIKFTKVIVVMVMVGLMLGSGLPMATASTNAPVS